MKQHLVIASIVSTLILICSVKYADGGAVMSVDLGSEWMKVSIFHLTRFKLNAIKLSKCHFVLMFLACIIE